MARLRNTAVHTVLKCISVAYSILDTSHSEQIPWQVWLSV